MLGKSKLIIAAATATTKGTPRTILLCLARTISRSSRLTSSSADAFFSAGASLRFSEGTCSDMAARQASLLPDNLHRSSAQTELVEDLRNILERPGYRGAI